MKWLAALVVVSHLAACEKAPEPYPVSPGGGGGTGTGTLPDGAVYDDGGSVTSGRVCLLSNPPSQATCSATGAGGLTVTLGEASAVTQSDGSFMLPPEASGQVWFITGTNIKTSVIKYGAAKLPAIELATYQDMVASLQAIETIGQGALMTRVTRMGVAVSGATVDSMPAGDSLTYYDGQSTLEWQTQQTGTLGIAWIPSVPAGAVQLAITSDQAQTDVAGNLVFADAITFVLAEIP